MTRTRTRSLVFVMLLLSSSALAVQVGDALTVTTSDGQSISGTLVHETSSGLLIKTASRTQLVQYDVITSVTEGAQATPSTAPRSSPPAPAPVRQRALPPPPPADPRREVVEDESTRPRVSDARVTFLASNKRNYYEVNVRGQRCTTPCTLDLDVGDTFISARGTGDVDANLQLPFGESSVRIQHGSAGRGVGLVLQMIGGLAALASLAVFPLNLTVGLIMVATGVALAVPGLIIFFASPVAGMQVMPARRRAELPGLGWQGV